MLIDIACNATHDGFIDTFSDVIKRAREKNVLPLIVGLDIASSAKAVEMAAQYDTFCYVGVHPLHYTHKKNEEGTDTQCVDIESSLLKLAENPRVIAIGECGLDFFRDNNREEQIELFKQQLNIRTRRDIPFFFHCRAAYSEFVELVDEFEQTKGVKLRGVVHSFDGLLEEAKMLIERGFYIGINGASLKTKENCEVVKSLPGTSIMIETDSPWCLIRKSYWGANYTTVIKSKFNEPSYLYNVLDAIQEIRGENIEKQVLKNTAELFPAFAKYLN
ncbi:TatD DNase family protein [Enteropsectra breve]|nr:TatD DNase family protein [Enteropsectra breve]